MIVLNHFIATTDNIYLQHLICNQVIDNHYSMQHSLQVNTLLFMQHFFLTQCRILTLRINDSLRSVTDVSLIDNDQGLIIQWELQCQCQCQCLNAHHAVEVDEPITRYQCFQWCITNWWSAPMPMPMHETEKKKFKKHHYKKWHVQKSHDGKKRITKKLWKRYHFKNHLRQKPLPKSMSTKNHLKSDCSKTLLQKRITKNSFHIKRFWKNRGIKNSTWDWKMVTKNQCRNKNWLGKK